MLLVVVVVTIVSISGTAYQSTSTAEPYFQTFDDEWEEWLEVEDDLRQAIKRVQVVLSSATHNRAIEEPSLFW